MCKKEILKLWGLICVPRLLAVFFCDEFFTVPAGDHDDFVPALLDIATSREVDLILPQSSYEILAISKHKQAFQQAEIPVLVADYDAVERGGDKWMTYEAIEGTKIPIPNPIACNTLEEFKSAVFKLGYPEKKVCFKPPYSKGTRGFRILTAESSRFNLLLYERPDAMLMTMEEALDILGEAEKFPALIVMEYVPGKEYTVDMYCKEGKPLCGFVKTREAIRSGLAMYFEIVDRPDLWEYSEIIVDKLNLDYFVNIQFKGDRLLEVNPRVSTFVHQEDFNMPYLGIKHFLGEISDEELQVENKKIRPTRRTVRYFDQTFYDVSQ